MKEFTIAQLAEKFQRDRSSILRWIQSGKFPNARLITSPLGEYWIIPAGDIENFKLPTPGVKKSKILELRNI